MAKKSKLPEPKIIRPDDIDPHHRWYRPLQAPGHTQVDFEERIDFRRLHDYRLARTRAALANSGLGALLSFDQHNIRYTTSTVIGEWARDKLTRYSLLTGNGDPYIWDFGSAARHHRRHAPWLHHDHCRAGLLGLRGAVGIFLASIPMLVGLPGAYLYFDVAFVVVLSSLLVQGWTVALAARKLDISFARADPLPRRVELDLPGQLAREIVGYPVPANSPFLRRGLIPNWARPTLVIRKEEILTPSEAHPVREGDYVYLLAPPEKAQALDRFFVKMPPPASPDPALLGDFFVPGTATLGALADIYGLQVAADHTEVTLADYFSEQLRRRVKVGDVVELGPIALLAHKVESGRAITVGLRLAEPEAPTDLIGHAETLWKRIQKYLG
jgi:hypothetical protein